MADAELSLLLARARALPEGKQDGSLGAMLQQARDIPYSSRPTPLGPPPERKLNYPTKFGAPETVELIPESFFGPAETMTIQNPEIDYGPPSLERGQSDEERMAAYGAENPPSFGDRWTNMSSAIVRGFTGGMASIPQGVSWAASQIDRMFGKDKDLKDYALYQLGESLKKTVDEQVPADPRLARVFETKVGEAIGNAPVFIGSGELGMLGKVGRLPPMVMMGASQSAVSSYDEAKAAGADEETAKAVSSYSALLGGVTMPLPYYRIMGRLNAASGGALNAALRGGTEAGVAGVIQRMGENKIAQVYDKERPLLEGVVESGGVGGIVGALSAGLLRAGRSLVSRPGYEAEIQAETAPKEPPSKSAELTVESTFKMTPEEAAKLGIEGGVFDDVTTQNLAKLFDDQAMTKKKFAAAIGKKLADVKEVTRSSMREIVGRAKEFQDAQEGLSTVRGDESQIREGGDGLRSGPRASGEDSQRQGLQSSQAAQEAHATSVKPEFGPPGVVSFAQLADTIKQGWSGLKALTKRNFLPEGDLPKRVFQLAQEKQHEISAITTKAAFNGRDFEAALKKSPLGNTPQGLAQIDAAMKTTNGIAALPAELQSAAQAMRDHTDVLSQRLIDEGVVAGPLAVTVAQNKGVYLNRSYRVFDDPKWADKVDPLVRNKFKAWLLSQNPGMSGNQAEQKINELLYEGKAAQGPIAFLSRSKLGAKDLSILKGRTLDNFPELRALYGEYTDPMTNYAKSVVRMANLLENHKFLEAVKADGMGKYLFDATDPNIDPQAKVRIAADASDVLYPLNGLRTYPEIESAFRESVQRQPDGPTWFKWYTKANIATKMAKTVFSHTTQFRNWLGNVNLLVANGYWRVGKSYDAARVALEDLGITKNDVWRQQVEAGSKYGILRQSVQAGDIHEMLRDLKKSGGGLDDALGGPLVKTGKAVGRVALELYGLGDDAPRFYAWLNEQARYRKAYPNWTPEQVQKHTAEIVNRVMPTYEALPPIVKQLRHFPGGNTFVSFPASMVKATYNIVKQSFTELAVPETRAIGAQRLAGLIAAKTGPKLLAATTAAMLGITSDDDKAIRGTLPPWDKNGQLLWLQKPSQENGFTIAYVNLSSLDPFGMFDRALIAGLGGKDPAAGLAAGAAELLKNFIGEQIVFENIVDVLRNKKGSNGQPVYNAEDDGDRIFADVAQHLGQSVIPGSYESLSRLGKAASGKEESKTGKVYDPTTETIAQFGLRASKVNLKVSLYYRAKEFARRTADAESIAAGKLLAAGPVSDIDLADSRDRSERNRRELFEQFHQEIVGLRGLGMPDEEIVKALRFAGLSQLEAASVFSGQYVPYQPSQQGVRSTAKKLSITNPKGMERLEERLTPQQ